MFVYKELMKMFEMISKGAYEYRYLIGFYMYCVGVMVIPIIFL